MQGQLFLEKMAKFPIVPRPPSSINSVAHLPDSLDGVVEGVAHCGAPPVGGRGPVVDVGTEDGLTTQ